MQRKEISTSTFTFERLIENNALYVDKTRYFYKLISGVNNCYFLSRPRRFGKSLAVSILKNIFLGRRDLFKGLYIDNTDYVWQEFPVIHIDMAQNNVSTVEKLTCSLNKNIDSIARQYDLQLNNSDPAINFNDLIQSLKEKFGKNVVILVDEYDRPLTENLDNAEKLEKMRGVLSEFYQMIKGNEPNERFVFMTGVTRFSKVSIFSKLNNLTDISMTRDYGEMFGYTQEELETNFAPYIDKHVAESGCDRAEFIAEIKRWYDGFKFHWKSQTVYNPVSVGQFFAKDCEFHNYWFATATPTFITKVAKQQRLLHEDIENAKATDYSLNTFDLADFAKGKVSKQKLILLLLQTGYLTINEKLDFGTSPIFSLRFPNFEVADSFENILFEVYCGMDSDEAMSYVTNITEAANCGKMERLIELLKNFLAEIPYTIQLPHEKYYQTLFFLVLKMCGMKVNAEDATNKGRIDAVLDTKNAIYVIEFKLNKDSDEAVEQILRNEYFQKFIENARTKQKKIIGLGINFSTEERNITEWQTCELH